MNSLPSSTGKVFCFPFCLSEITLLSNPSLSLGCFTFFFLWSSTSQPRGLGRGKGFHGKRVVGGITHRKYHPKCHPAITSWHAALPRRHIIAFCIKLKSLKMMWLWQVLDIRRVREISCSLTLRAPLQGRCSLFCLNEGSALSPVCFVNPPEKQTNWQSLGENKDRLASPLWVCEIWVCNTIASHTAFHEVLYHTLW